MSTCTLIRRSADPSTYRILVALSLFLTLAGCATCREHPVGCSAVAAVVATSLAFSLRHHPVRRAKVART